MKNHFIPFAVGALLLVAAVGMSAEPAAVPADAPYLDPAKPVEARVKDLLGRMTLEEKVAQMDLWIFGDAQNAVGKKLIPTYGLGGTLGEITAEKQNELQKLAEQQRLKIPLLIQIDACHGNALEQGATVFPTNISMAATFNPALAGRVARQAACEIRAWGQHATYTPTLDVTWDPRFGRSGETFGECPTLTSLMANAYVRGYQGDLSAEHGGVVACPKHFVGGGASVGGCNHASAEISDRTLRQVFLKPFKAAVEAGALMIMAGHNDINGIPAHANYELMTKVLKDEWGFQGFIVSDMGDVRNLHSKLHNVAATHEDALAMGMNAGVDMYMNSHNLAEFFEPMCKLAKEGKIPMARIDDAVSRILRVKFRLGLFEHRYLDPAKTAKAFGSPEALATALQASRECLALVKNQNGLLPLSPERQKRIFVTGPDAATQAILGDWASPQKQTITVIDGIRKAAGDKAQVDFFDCGRITGKTMAITAEMAATADPRLLEQKLKDSKSTITDWSIAEAVRQAKACDVAVAVVGGYAIRAEWGLRTYGESCDMPSIGLPGRQLELVQALHATGKPVVVVYVSGKVVSEPWITDTIPAILYAWEPGQFGGQAIAEVLFGQVNPSGRLPFTIPKSIGHIPQYYYQRESRYWTGHWGTGNNPAFPFGFGLSYTTYAYSNLTVPATVPATAASVPVTVTVTNTGKMAGDEAVLVYTRQMVATVSPYVKMLRGVEKIHLEPGESKTVTIAVPMKELGFWNADMKFVVEPGEFKAMAGDKTASFRIE